MQQQMDLAELRARFEVVRRSEYFPAVLGAVAGGLTGALMAGLIAGSRRGASNSSGSGGTAGEGSSSLLGLSAKDVIQLAGVVASLARQIQEWRGQS